MYMVTSHEIVALLGEETLLAGCEEVMYVVSCSVEESKEPRAAFK